MIRASFIALSLLAAPATAAGTVMLGDRPGGFTHQHIAQAGIWLRGGKRLVIGGVQQSAAAIQIVWFTRRGGSACYLQGRDVRLQFHLSTIAGGRGMTNTIATHLGRRNAGLIGKLPRHGFKSFHPSTFGIGACK